MASFGPIHPPKNVSAQHYNLLQRIFVQACIEPFEHSDKMRVPQAPAHPQLDAKAGAPDSIQARNDPTNLGLVPLGEKRKNKIPNGTSGLPISGAAAGASSSF